MPDPIATVFYCALPKSAIWSKLQHERFSTFLQQKASLMIALETASDLAAREGLLREILVRHAPLLIAYSGGG